MMEMAAKPPDYPMRRGEFADFWEQLTIYADWLDDQEQRSLANAYRWMGRTRSYPFNTSWFSDRRYSNDQDASNLADALLQKMVGMPDSASGTPTGDSDGQCRSPSWVHFKDQQTAIDGLAVALDALKITG